MRSTSWSSRSCAGFATGGRGTKETFLEVRAGTGGEEAALFAQTWQMYQRLSQRRGWRFQVLSAEESEHGGFREAVAEVSGQDCYNRMRYEAASTGKNSQRARRSSGGLVGWLTAGILLPR